MTIASAYQPGRPELTSASAEFLSAPGGDAPHWPAGRVGLTFTDLADIPRLLAEIVARHAHYRAGATVFARRWSQAHAAERTIEQLTLRALAGAPARAHAA